MNRTLAIDSSYQTFTVGLLVELIVNVLSVTCFLTFFADVLPSFIWGRFRWGEGGKELKWCQLAHYQLISQKGPHSSPNSKAKANYKSTNLRKIGN